MPIEKLGDILLQERLAAGGMAEVFRAKQYGHSGFEKTVAVKRILPAFSAREEYRTMFRLEANLSAQLQHPNIAQVFSNGLKADFLYIVMEYVDGKNLRELSLKTEQKRVRIPIELACYIVCETAKGLDFAHNAVDEKTGAPLNIIHRDMNHRNIMLSYEGGIKIVDFGVAKATDQDPYNTRAGVLKGKVAYMSPEQVRGKKIDRRTDIFSLGIVLWELLAGRTLFVSEDELTTMENIRNCEVPKISAENSEIPEPLTAIVERALAQDLEQRYQSAKELCSDLQRFSNEYFPRYIQSDVSTYLKDIFQAEIAEEKIRKDKVNLETKIYLQSNPMLKPGKTRIFGDEIGSQSIALQANQSVAKLEPATVLTGAKVPDQRVADWRATQSAVNIPSFNYESTRTQVSSITSQNPGMKLVVFLLVLATGLIFMVFKERERLLFASFDNSRFEAWDEQFRTSFVQSCVADLTFSVADKHAVCQCLSSAVENSHILTTKFNPNITTEESLAQKNLGRLQNFLNSSEGSQARGLCERNLAGTNASEE